MRLRHAHLVLALLALGACESPGRPTVTWTEDVGPFVVARCGGCHVEGGVATMQLDRYEAALPWASAMRAAIEERRMPPFLADGSGACGDLRDEGHLSDDELTLVRRWIDDGLVRGDGPEPTRVQPRRLPRVDVEVSMPTAFVSSVPVGDEYRCFVIDPGLEEDRFLTGYEVVPGDESIVHHAIVFAPIDDAGEESARAMSGADGRDGYPCYGDALVPALFIAEWGPGQGAVALPEGTGIRLRARRSLILQVHYSTRGATPPDRTSVRMMLEDAVELEGHSIALVDPEFDLAPRLAEVRHTFTTTITAPMTLRAITPHMHTLGTTIRVHIHRAGTRECALDVPRWDFGWQRQYTYETPVEVGFGDEVEVECVFDTRSREAPTTFGWGTSDEMCLAFLYVTY